jgi:signal transduction histidine kinase
MTRQPAELAQALAGRDPEQDQRILRLEHDLKSPLGAILGFATLLREMVQADLKDSPPAVLKSINGIDQAARKMLRIIEDAGETAAKTAAAEPAPPGPSGGGRERNR